MAMCGRQSRHDPPLALIIQHLYLAPFLLCIVILFLRHCIRGGFLVTHLQQWSDIVGWWCNWATIFRDLSKNGNLLPFPSCRCGFYDISSTLTSKKKSVMHWSLRPFAIECLLRSFSGEENPRDNAEKCFGPISRLWTRCVCLDYRRQWALHLLKAL